MSIMEKKDLSNITPETIELIHAEPHWYGSIDDDPVNIISVWGYNVVDMDGDIWPSDEDWK